MSGIVRVQKRETYTAISNAPLRDASLSWEARGVLAYLLSKPNNWQVLVGDLVNQGPASRGKVNRVLRELEECGYLLRERIHNEHGRFVWRSTVYEESTITQNTIDGKPMHGEPIDGELTLRNTDSKNIPESRTISPSISYPSSNSTDASASVGPKVGKTKAQSKRSPSNEKALNEQPIDLSPKKGADPRTRSPAIRAFRSVTGRYPRKNQYDSIIKAVGEHPKLPLLKSCWVEWSERGYSPVNVKWVIDWYRSGSVPRNGGPPKKAKEQHFYEAGNIPEEMFLKSELSSTFTSPERKEEIKAIFRAMEGAG